MVSIFKGDGVIQDTKKAPHQPAKTSGAQTIPSRLLESAMPDRRDFFNYATFIMGNQNQNRKEQVAHQVVRVGRAQSRSPLKNALSLHLA